MTPLLHKKIESVIIFINFNLRSNQIKRLNKNINSLIIICVIFILTISCSQRKFDLNSFKDLERQSNNNSGEPLSHPKPNKELQDLMNEPFSKFDFLLYELYTKTACESWDDSRYYASYFCMSEFPKFNPSIGSVEIDFSLMLDDSQESKDLIKKLESESVSYTEKYFKRKFIKVVQWLKGSSSSPKLGAICKTLGKASFKIKDNACKKINKHFSVKIRARYSYDLTYILERNDEGEIKITIPKFKVHTN